MSAVKEELEREEDSAYHQDMAVNLVKVLIVKQKSATPIGVLLTANGLNGQYGVTAL